MRVVDHEVLPSRTCTAFFSAEEDVGGDGCYACSHEHVVSLVVGGPLDALEQFSCLLHDGEGDKRGER